MAGRSRQQPLPRQEGRGNLPPLPADVRAALEEVIRYLWADELRDFERATGTARRLHVFRRLFLLRNWLNQLDGQTR